MVAISVARNAPTEALKALRVTLQLGVAAGIKVRRTIGTRRALRVGIGRTDSALRRPKHLTKGVAGRVVGGLIRILRRVHAREIHLIGRRGLDKIGGSSRRQFSTLNF
jgi:hypothetical protein